MRGAGKSDPWQYNERAGVQNPPGLLMGALLDMKKSHSEGPAQN
jgi:hypothetical protein